jgi:hypothetical protein
MYSRQLGAFVGYCFGLTLLTILIFSALRWLNIPSGHFVDWIIGTATLWWLLVIVTVPWNVYFEARGVADEAAHSASIGINLEAKQLQYVNNVSRNALIIAIALHFASAAGLFALSAAGITPVGYIGSGAALLLTVLRPSVRAYEYLWERLLSIRHRVKYPREDVVELRNRTQTLEAQVASLERQLNPAEPHSFAANEMRTHEEIKVRLQTVATEQNRSRDENAREHERLAHEAQNGIAKLSADSQFLDHVREIVRLIKSA